MNDFLTKVNEIIDKNEAEMISSLSKLISIPSVAVETPGDHPFGDAVHEAFEAMLEMGVNAGFDIYNADNYGGHIEFKAYQEPAPQPEPEAEPEPQPDPEIVGVVGHLDVVPEGDAWEFDPYGGEVIDGKICGRGSMDDKGPTLAAFYGIKALKEAGFKPSKSIRVILGLDEETNWHGMDYYLAHVDRVPDCGFTPDADFPVIHGEKGIMVFDIVKKFRDTKDKGLELSSIKGGTANNAVAGCARAVVHDSAGNGYELVKAAVSKFRDDKKCKINCKGIGKSFEITIQGIPAHGATPEKGLNAISLMMEFLGRLNLVNDSIAEFIDFYNQKIGFNLNGENMGCAFEDEPSGKLVFNVGLIEMDKKSVTLTINVRYPVTYTNDQVYDGMEDVLREYDCGVIKGSKKHDPIYRPVDDPMIQTYLRAYRDITGDMESEPLVIGGGTFARAFENIVAFGARFPGQPGLEHQRNEYNTVENITKLAKIYAQAVYNLAK